MSSILDNFELIYFFVLLVVGYVTGSCLEAKHFRSILERENSLALFPTVSTKRVPKELAVQQSWLVMGEVVISIDYFKRFLAFLQSLVGWNVTAYETLLDRARREAILRMKEQAKHVFHADLIINTRIETSSIAGKESGNRKSVTGIELYAYGTALKLSEESHGFSTTSTQK